MLEKIKLTQNQFALVDDNLFDELNQYKWYAQKGHNTYYVKRNKKYNEIYMHRVVLNLECGDGMIVDHINGNGLDNRKENLRVVTNIENCHNRRIHSHNTSGYTGICWVKRYQKWLAQIVVGGKQVCLGYHSNILDAIESRKQGEIKYWGGIQYG